MAKLRWWDLFRMALRSALLQATWNYERQQGVGWAFSLHPALQRLIPGKQGRCERLAEHTAYFNTQPTLASLALGAVAALEEQREAGAGPDAAAVARAKSALGSSLAVLGDRLFWMTLRPFAACLGAAFALGGMVRGALAMWVCYNAVHLTWRFLGTGWGYRSGPAVLGKGLRASLERLTRLAALGGCVVIGVLIAALLAPHGAPRRLVFQVAMMAGIGVGFVVAQRPRPSPTEWALGAAVLCVAASWLRHP
ncbi:MAG: PTS mannose/fructose/sorbose transporter family subunit IID [Candidatus Eisenbacteria bacterium]|nr:PTS mannose/fructose/sorbose transporter family subunit IID [Candidatus Eisenbacteria bacterium]